jgi:hypothetical protein
MTYQDVTNFPFIDFGLFLIMLALAVQILRGKMTGGIVEFVKANKGAFDQDTDALIMLLAQRVHEEPGKVHQFIESLYLFATGEPLNPTVKAKAAEGSAKRVLGSVPVVTGESIGLRLSNEYPPVNIPQIVREHLPEHPDAGG